MAIKIGSSLFVDGHKVYRWRGDLTVIRPRLSNHLEELDLLTMDLAKHDVSSSHPDKKLPEPITGCACAMLNGRAYTFGGFSQLRDENTYYRKLYQLDLATLSWQHLSAVNDVDGPIKKYLCGMVPCDGGNELFIFGGFGEKSDGIPLQKGSDYHWSEEFRAMWTNEMHLYSLLEKRWIIPQCTGVRPPPCAAFSFTKIDKHRVLLFAGRQMKQRSNEVHILDMHCWHWSGAITQNRVDQLWPSERSLHTAACLFDPDIVPLICDHSTIACSSQSSSHLSNVQEQQVLVLWGQDSNGDQLCEAWILKTVSMMWERIPLPQGLEGRKWHSTIDWYPSPCESLIITMGGFEKDAVWNKPLEHDTVIFHFGVKSLYKLCLKTVAENYSRTDLTTCLPRHIIEEMSAQENTEKRLNLQQILYHEY